MSSYKPDPTLQLYMILTDHPTKVKLTIRAYRVTREAIGALTVAGPPFEHHSSSRWSMTGREANVKTMGERLPVGSGCFRLACKASQMGARKSSYVGMTFGGIFDIILLGDGDDRGSPHSRA